MEKNEITRLQKLDAEHHLHPFIDNAVLARKGTRILSRGEGVYVWDAEGNKLLDAFAGLWCVNLGYGRKELGEAAKQQMDKLSYYNSFFQCTVEPTIQLATKLAELTPADLNHAFFTNSGSEANDTILRLAQVPGIVGVKDATGNLDRACDLIARAPKNFALYSGDDMTCVASIMLGFHGNISVTANVAPRLMHEMCVAAAAGDVARAREIHFKLLGLHRDLFCEANPIPVKWAVQQLGLMSGGIRLPLTTLSEANQPRVRAAMQHAGLVD